MDTTFEFRNIKKETSSFPEEKVHFPVLKVHFPVLKVHWEWNSRVTGLGIDMRV